MPISFLDVKVMLLRLFPPYKHLRTYRTTLSMGKSVVEKLHYSIMSG